MTTKRARERKSKTTLGKTVARTANTRKRRKALTAKRMVSAAEEVAASIKAAAKPPVNGKNKKATSKKSAPHTKKG